MKKITSGIVAGIVLISSCQNNNNNNNGTGNTHLSRVQTIKYRSSTIALSYDNQGRLSSSGGRSYTWKTDSLIVAYGSDVRGYRLNGAGYVISNREVYNSQNRLTGKGSASYIWSGDNIISIQNSDGSVGQSYEYYTDYETRDYGLKYFPSGYIEGPTRTQIGCKNLPKQVLHNYMSGIPRDTIDYVYTFDSRGRVITETETRHGYFQNCQGCSNPLIETFNYTYFD